MDTKELMLNDLVLFNNRVCKIVTINAYIDYVELIDISDEDNEVIGRYAKHINSIPLTAEILEKNGFGIRNDFAFAKNTKCDIKIDLTNQINSSISSYNGFSIYWQFQLVHELQHALRLCGLNEFADNFKIE